MTVQKVSINSQISAVENAINPPVQLAHSRAMRELHSKHLAAALNSLLYLKGHRDVITKAVMESLKK